MSRLDLSDLDSIIENLENSEECIKNILEEQSSTIFHTQDYYEGALKVYEEIIPMLKIYQSKEDKIINNRKLTDEEINKLCEPRKELDCI